MSLRTNIFFLLFFTHKDKSKLKTWWGFVETDYDVANPSYPKDLCCVTLTHQRNVLAPHLAT